MVLASISLCLLSLFCTVIALEFTEDGGSALKTISFLIFITFGYGIVTIAPIASFSWWGFYALFERYSIKNKKTIFTLFY